MKRFVLVALVACGGGEKPAVEKPVTPPPPQAFRPSAGPLRATPNIVRDTMHGVVVEDPYRWLEGDDANVKEWAASQSTHAHRVLDGLPEIEALRQELTAIYKAPITTYGGLRRAGRKLFAYRKQPQKEQAELIVFDDIAKVADARIVVDPTAGGTATRAIDWAFPSPDGTRVAVSMSEKGSEKGDLSIVDLEGKLLEPVIPNVYRGTGGGNVAWTPDGKGLYYTRYPSAGERPDAELDFWMQVYFHELGKPASSDRYELGKDLPKIAEVILESDPRGRVLAKVQNGDGGEYRHYLRDAKGAWRQLDDWQDRITYVGFGTTPDLWVVSIKDAPRGKILRLAANAKSTAEAKVVIAEGKDTIATDFWNADWGVVDAGDRIYVTYQVGGPTELRAFTRAGKPAKAPVLPAVSSSSKPVVLADGIVVSAVSYTTPRAYYKLATKSGTTEILDTISPKPTVELAATEVVREYATSKDGTKVPFTIIWPKGAPRDGSVPCLARGYGGYGSSEAPAFVIGHAPLLARGICLVETNLRGGGEFGEEWHRAGMLTNKQNVFDDFAAVLQFLVDNKVTSTSRLAILGGSNGGLLMGATLVQHPALVKAVVSLVGVYDSLRSELSTNGAFNVTEYGTVKDKAQFEAMRAYSPYHNVKPAAYPAILMMTGDNDARVAPWHSRKFTAALQAANTGGAPILLRTSATAGHGSGTAASERIAQTAQMQAFILWQIRGR
jgi:prolyl oligopeptidase